MKLENSIRSKIEAALQPLFLQVANESHLHSRLPGSETHFNVIVVSHQFEGLSRVDRSRRVQALLEDERKAGLHALALKTFTPSEWPAAQASLDLTSPPCLHKS